MKSSAIFSGCGKYRYTLTRTWMPNKGHVIFGLLNPSKANAIVRDPTDKRAEGFTRRWNKGGYTLLNLFALVSTIPGQLTEVDDPVGPDNEWHWRNILSDYHDALMICAWGNHGSLMKQCDAALLWIFEQEHQPQALKMTSKVQPYHLLYLSYDLLPFTPYEWTIDEYDK